MFSNSFTLADFFDFSEFQSKKKRRATNKINQLYFSFSDKKQVFTLNLLGSKDVYLDYSRFQRIKANIFEKNGIKNVVISSNVSIENRLRFALALHFVKAFDFDVMNKQSFDDILVVNPFKSIDLPLFKEEYDGFRLRIYHKENPEIYEWSNLGSFPLLMANTPICYKSRIFRDNDNFEYFNLIAVSQKIFEKYEISFNYPTKISNLLPFNLKIRLRNHYKPHENTNDNKITWNKSFDFNEILNFSLEIKKFDSDEGLFRNSKYHPSKESSKNNLLSQSNPGKDPSNKIDSEKQLYEEVIEPGSNIYSNLIEYNSIFSLSLLAQNCNWSDYLEISPNFDKNPKIFQNGFEERKPSLEQEENKEFFYFQLFNSFQEQTTIVLEKTQENGVNNLVFFSELWLLNETPFPLLARIKESNFENPPLQMPEFCVNLKERPMGPHLQLNGFSNISGTSHFKERNLNAISFEQINYPLNSCENFEKIFASLNASYFSAKDLKDLLKKQNGHLIPFSGNLNKNNKKISFKIENLSGWSDFQKISENKTTVFSQFQKDNLCYNFNYLNIRLPGKFKRTSLLFVTPKYFLINLSEFQLEVKILEGKIKKNLIKLEKGMIESLFNFKDENEIKISVRIYKSDYIWTSEYFK